MKLKKERLPKIIDAHKHKFPSLCLVFYDFRHNARGKSFFCGFPKYNIKTYKNKIETSAT